MLLSSPPLYTKTGSTGEMKSLRSKSSSTCWLIIAQWPLQSLPNYLAYFTPKILNDDIKMFVNWHEESWMQSVVVSQSPIWASAKGRSVAKRRRPALQGNMALQEKTNKALQERLSKTSLAGALGPFMPTQVTDTHSHPQKNILLTQCALCSMWGLFRHDTDEETDS